MLEIFSTIGHKITAPVRTYQEHVRQERIAANEHFERSQALYGLLGPERQAEEESRWRSAFDAEMERMGIVPIDMQQVDELSKLPLREIEERLDVTERDNYFGRHFPVFPTEKPETPRQQKKRERDYEKFMRKLDRE